MQLKERERLENSRGLNSGTQTAKNDKKFILIIYFVNII